MLTNPPQRDYRWDMNNDINHNRKWKSVSFYIWRMLLGFLKVGSSGMIDRYVLCRSKWSFSVTSVLSVSQWSLFMMLTMQWYRYVTMHPKISMDGCDFKYFVLLFHEYTFYTICLHFYFWEHFYFWAYWRYRLLYKWLKKNIVLLGGDKIRSTLLSPSNKLWNCSVIISDLYGTDGPSTDICLFLIIA